MIKFFSTRTARAALTTVLTVATVAFSVTIANAAEPSKACEKIALTQAARPGETVLVCDTVRPTRPVKPAIAKINKKQTACQRMPTLCSALH